MVRTGSPAVQSLVVLKDDPVSVLAAESEERVHKENDALDDAERALGQASVAERRVVAQLLEEVDVQRASGDEQGAADEREEEIHTAVHRCAHHTADEQADQDDQVSAEGAHGYHRGMMISSVEGVVVQPDEDAYQEELKEFYDRQPRNSGHFD